VDHIAFYYGQVLYRSLWPKIFDTEESKISDSSIFKNRLTRWFSSFIAAWLSIKLLQSKESPAYTNIAPSSLDSSKDVTLKSTRFAGRTMDLTLFAATRAVDVVVGEIWDRRRACRIAARKWTAAEAAISSLADPIIFASSCALIMWCWFYLPERLPRAYNKWIAGAAAVDARLITALNHFRWGELIYGQDTGQAPLLQSMCADYKWPQIWGDPAKTIPFPCEMVHMGMGKSCEYHAFRRFLKGSLMAGGMYGPLNLALQLRNPSKEGMKKALISSIRSSAFLGSFIALFYYGVCLARTRVGPHILGSDVQSRQIIDSGVCIGSGCMLCGWSLLLENQGRRKDIALFVAPRALATLLPRRYEMKYQWRETAVFATSTAIVFTCVQENPARVRGVLGKILSSVIVQ
jgi:hypothetical protein